MLIIAHLAGKVNDLSKRIGMMAKNVIPGRFRDDIALGGKITAVPVNEYFALLQAIHAGGEL